MTGLRSLGSRAAGMDKSALGIITLVAATAIFVLVYTNTPSKLLAPDGQTVRAVFKTSAQLVPGSPVRVHGVEAGRVKKVTLNPGGRSSTVEMDVYEDAQPVYANATAAIRWRTLVGTMFIVDLDPGTSRAGELGSRPIPESRTTTQVELEDITSVVKGGAKSGLRNMLHELPRALRDDHAPAQALGAVAEASPSLTRALRSLRGQRSGDLGELVANTARTVRALDTPTDRMRHLIEGAAVTFDTTARRQAELGRTIEQSARVMPGIVETVKRLDTTFAIADPVLARLRDRVGDVAPTLATLRPTVVDANRLLSDARPLLRSLRPAATSLATSAREGGPLLRDLAPSLMRIDQRILPDLALESPETKHATYEMFGPSIAALTGPFGFFDDENNFVRFLASGGEKALDSAPCRTLFTDSARAKEVANCDALLVALAKLFGGKS